MTWSVDPYTVKYHTHIPTPTGIPADPALSSYGEKQASQLATKLAKIDPPIAQVISSPYYRCLQTIKPCVEKLQQQGYTNGVFLESGFEEWYGETGDKEQPSPAPFEELRNKHFPELGLRRVDAVTIRPNKFGESIEALHNRIAFALQQTIEQADREGWEAVVICTHAAAMIAIGRVLTGKMPQDVEEEDFKCFTCSLSRFDRRKMGKAVLALQDWDESRPEIVPDINWRDGKGVMGGWETILNGDCSFLSGGEERGWHFSGDESFLRDPNAFNDKENEEAEEGGAVGREKRSRI